MVLRHDVVKELVEEALVRSNAKVTLSKQVPKNKYKSYMLQNFKNYILRMYAGKGYVVVYVIGSKNEHKTDKMGG